MPTTLLMVLAALVAFMAFPDRGLAAPVIETTAAREFTCTAGSIAPDCLGLQSVGVGGSAAFGLLRLGGSLLDGAAASAIYVSESFAPVPLPAAGWLLIAGLGGLGLFGRRRQGALPTLRPARDGIEPVVTSLRGGGRVDATTEPRAPALIRDAAAVRGRLRALMRAGGERLRAFAPGRISPVRPCGGAGHRYAATAERAPPLSGADAPFGAAPNSGNSQCLDAPHSRVKLGGVAYLVVSVASRMSDLLAPSLDTFSRCNQSERVEPAYATDRLRAVRQYHQNRLSKYGSYL